MTESEATIPVKVFRVQLYLNSLLYYVIHISCGFIQEGGATENDVVPISNLCTAMADF
jgi:hypothetical protein